MSNVYGPNADPKYDVLFQMMEIFLKLAIKIKVIHTLVILWKVHLLF